MMLVKLQLVEFEVESLFLDEFLVGANFLDLAPVEYNNLIRLSDG